MDPVFLPLDEVLEIHQQQIERYGGFAGLRDAGGLESAIATPQVTFGGAFLHGSIPSMAAAYLFHLCQNHAFIDGDKRVGANAAITFLLMNGWKPTFDPDELVDLVLSVASGRIGKQRLIDLRPAANRKKTPKGLGGNRQAWRFDPCQLFAFSDSFGVCAVRRIFFYLGQAAKKL